MVTLITFSISNELEFRESHYKRVRQIAGLTTIVISALVLLLMVYYTIRGLIGVGQKPEESALVVTED